MDTSGIGHQHGNFHNYYAFHSIDERISMIPQGCFYSIWESLGKPSKFCMLDVGCNEGSLTL